MNYPQVFVDSVDLLTMLLAISALLWMEILLGAVAFILIVLITRGKFPKKSQKKEPVVKLSKKEQRAVSKRQGRQFLRLLMIVFGTSLIGGQFLGWYLQERLLIAILTVGLIIVVWMLAQFKFPRWVLIGQVLLAVSLAFLIAGNQGTWIYPQKIVHKSVLANKGIVEKTFVPSDKMQLIIYCTQNLRAGGYRQPRQQRYCGSYLRSPTVSRFGVAGDINLRRIDDINAAIISTFNLQCSGSYKIDENPEFFEVICSTDSTVD